MDFRIEIGILKKITMKQLKAKEQREAANAAVKQKEIEEQENINYVIKDDYKKRRKRNTLRRIRLLILEMNWINLRMLSNKDKQLN